MAAHRIYISLTVTGAYICVHQSVLSENHAGRVRDIQVFTVLYNIKTTNCIKLIETYQFPRCNERTVICTCNISLYMILLSYVHSITSIPSVTMLHCDYMVTRQ